MLDFQWYESQLFWISTHIFYFIVLLKLRVADDSVWHALVGETHTDSHWFMIGAQMFFNVSWLYTSMQLMISLSLGIHDPKILFEVPQVLSATWIINMSVGSISLVTFPSVRTFCQAFWSSAYANASALLNGDSLKRKEMT